MNEHHQRLAVIAAVIGAAAVGAWLIMLPDDPKVALRNGTVAVALASIVMPGKLLRDHERK